MKMEADGCVRGIVPSFCIIDLSLVSLVSLWAKRWFGQVRRGSPFQGA